MILLPASLIIVFACTTLLWPQGTASATSAVPPPGQSLAAAREAVAQRAAAAGRAADRLAAAQARLTQIEAQAETITERYDGAIVELRRDTGAYRIAQDRSSAAARAEAARRSAVAELASEAYQTDGGFGSMAATIGEPGGPQASFDRAGVLQVLAEHDTDILASAVASSVVARVFRTQARDALQASQAAARRVGALKQAAAAAVARQQRVLRSTEATRNRLARQLAAARARVGALEAAAAQAASPSSSAVGASSSVPEWAYASGSAAFTPASAANTASASAGDTAARWALGQLGKPYVWAAAGPYSFDCSGLTMRAWQRAGVQLDHWTGTQWTSGPHIAIGQLRPGDLVFFANNTSDPGTIHHVGLYIGGNMMVDAPYTGVNVRIDSIFEPGLIGATRPLA